MSLSIIWLGWRLLVGKGGGLRQAGLITLGVTVGSALLFAMASIPGAVADRQARDSLREWLISGPSAEDGGLIAVGRDRLGEQSLTHLLIAPGSSEEIQPIGESLPGVGQALVSPALAEAIGMNPSLVNRVSGEVVGVLPDRLLLEPGEMVSLAVVEPDLIVATDEARALPTEPPPETEVTVPSDVMFVVTIALLVLALPVVMFISSATQFGLERRRARVKMLRLAGAEHNQIRLFVAMEAMAAAVLGVLLGFGLFLLARPVLAELPVGGRTAFSSALQSPLTLTLAVFGFVLVSAVVASFTGSRRLETDPSEARPGRRGSVVGVGLISLGCLGLAVGLIAPSESDVPHPLALVGMVSVAFGLPLAAKTIIALLGHWVSARTGNGVTLLAARQMDRAPAEVSRPLAAVVTAVFVVAAFFTITGTLLRSSNFRYDGLSPDRVLVEAPPDSLRQVAEQIGDRPEVEAFVLQGLVTVSTEGGDLVGMGVVADCDAVGIIAGFDSDRCQGGVLVSAGELLEPGSVLVVGSSPPLEESGVTTTVTFQGAIFDEAYPASVIVDPSLISDGFAEEISEAQIVVRVDPNQGDMEAFRTALVSRFPTAQVRSVAEVEYDQAVPAQELRVLATVGLVIVLGIATFSLSIGTASRLLQRRDAFAFLRAGGLLPGQIRRLVALESTVPLAVFAALSALLGVAAGAAVAISAGAEPDIPWPTIGLIYLGTVFLGVLVWSAFAPTLDRFTSPTGLRFE
jgi:hypothetical protein